MHFCALLDFLQRKPYPYHFIASFFFYTEGGEARIKQVCMLDTDNGNTQNRHVDWRSSMEMVVESEG